MGQMRTDGKPEGEPRRERIKQLIQDGGAHLNYEERVDEGIRRGIFSLKEITDAARKQWTSEIQRVARAMKDKSGAPAIIPVKGKPNQGVLLDVAKSSDRYLNVLRRGLQTFGNQLQWRNSVRDMEERGEETLPVAEWQEGWREILGQYRLEAVQQAIDEGGEDEGED